MRELKDYNIMDIEAMDDERLEKSESGKIQVTRVYIKSEADKVISTIRAERDEYRYNLSCARNEIHNLSMSMREDVKRIADKDKQIEELKNQRDGAFGLANLGLTLEDLTKLARKEIDRQKCKRCLAMAECCKRKRIDAANYRIPRKKLEFYDKWYNRWLTLADKYKEGNV